MKKTLDEQMNEYTERVETAWRQLARAHKEYAAL